MCDKAILENAGTLKYVSGYYKNQEMFNKVDENYPHVPECYKTQRYVLKLLILIRLQQNLFLNAIRLKKCVIEKFIDAFLYLILFLVNIKLMKYVT